MISSISHHLQQLFLPSQHSFHFHYSINQKALFCIVVSSVPFRKVYIRQAYLLRERKCTQCASNFTKYKLQVLIPMKPLPQLNHYKKAKYERLLAFNKLDYSLQGVLDYLYTTVNLFEVTACMAFFNTFNIRSRGLCWICYYTQSG